MYAVTTFLIVAVISLAFTKIAAGALIATGLPPHVAAFQARSAFTGAGFTTTEAENVVNHTTRRKVIATTMFVGGLGTPTLVVSVLLGLIAPGPGSTTDRTLAVVIGLSMIVLILGSPPVRRLLVRFGQRYARNRLSGSLVRQPVEALSLGGDHGVYFLPVATEPNEGVRSLRGLQSAFAPVRVLGIRRGDDYFGESPVDLTIHVNDELVLYGRTDDIEAIAQVPDGAASAT